MTLVILLTFNVQFGWKPRFSIESEGPNGPQLSISQPQDNMNHAPLDHKTVKYSHKTDAGSFMVESTT